jgi:type III restriction enzyme
MDTYWVPGVNNLGSYGRWAFAEFTDVYQIEADLEMKIRERFDTMILGWQKNGGQKNEAGKE